MQSGNFWTNYLKMTKIFLLVITLDEKKNRVLFG